MASLSAISNSSLADHSQFAKLKAVLRLLFSVVLNVHDHEAFATALLQTWLQDLGQLALAIRWLTLVILVGEYLEYSAKS